jgi:hypothetical protein
MNFKDNENLIDLHGTVETKILQGCLNVFV